MTLSIHLLRTRTRATLSPILILRQPEGSAALEFAFLLPVFLLMFLGIIEFGRLLWTQSALQHAVEAGARFAAINDPTCSGNQTTVYTIGQLFGLNSDPTIKLQCQACGTQVSATLDFKFVVPALLPYNVTLNAQSCYP